MVRVISVYNFLKQEITSIDESVDAIAVPPNLLCLVQPNNTILVKNLTLISDVGYTIPTVDQAVKIVYSLQGKLSNLFHVVYIYVQKYSILYISSIHHF